MKRDVVAGIQCCLKSFIYCTLHINCSVLWEKNSCWFFLCLFVLFCGLYACVCFFQSLHLFSFSKKHVCSKLFIYFPFPRKQFKVHKHFGDMAWNKVKKMLNFIQESVSTCIVTPCQWPGFICGHKGFIYIYIYVHVWTRGLQNQEEFWNVHLLMTWVGLSWGDPGLLTGR